MSSTTMSSPFALQLGTNYCPRDAEAAQIKAFLVEPCLRLKNLDGEIAVLRQTLDKLAEERDNLKAYVEAHKALISPIRRLPLDILGAIFTACLPTHRNCVMSAQEAPVILGWICSSWRSISLSMPKLWSRLHIVEPTPSDLVPESSEDYSAKVAQRLEVADAWLRRSGTCPLSISLESKLDNRAIGPAMLMRLHASPPQSPFLNVLLPFASRWQYMDLVLPLGLHEALSCLTEDDVPLLARLRMFHRPEAMDIPYLTQLGILHAPNLTSFCVVGGKTHSLHLPLRWSQLTDLSLEGTFNLGGAQTPGNILIILSRCPQLRTFRVLVHDPSESPLSHTIVECPFLHTIDLGCFGNPLRTAGWLLSRLSLPDLRDFKFRGSQLQQAEIASTELLLSSLASSNRLGSIGLDSAVFSNSKAVLIHFLLGLPPTVQRLEMTETMHASRRSIYLFDDGVMEVLNASLGATTACPVLQELVINRCYTVSDTALLSFVRSRQPTLKRVRVAFDREMQIDILPALQPSTQAGLDISLTYITLPPPSFSPWEGLSDGPSPVRLLQ
ncbi:hypothetical protein MSAN_00081100 [Mycena sanguinolenta]|uniref:F-box domain-containing protein n=1 Tax=Mycena sanguinolenta TaxID=230812 RepID=A0A8H6ZCW5_9AGAR|nr:hypothetical protein MSAN_00081100 [Mycena sanguinolenta]